MKEDILQLVKEKQSGTTGIGEKIYSNITESDLNKIISASIISTVNQIKNKIEVAGDEWETISLIEQQLKELEEEFGNKNGNKKNKINI